MVYFCWHSMHVAFGGEKANDYMTGVGDMGDMNIASCFHELRKFLSKGASCIERDGFTGVFSLELYLNKGRGIMPRE